MLASGGPVTSMVVVPGAAPAVAMVRNSAGEAIVTAQERTPASTAHHSVSAHAVAMSSRRGRHTRSAWSVTHARRVKSGRVKSRRSIPADPSRPPVSGDDRTVGGRVAGSELSGGASVSGIAVPVWDVAMGPASGGHRRQVSSLVHPAAGPRDRERPAGAPQIEKGAFDLSRLGAGGQGLPAR